MDFLSLDPLLIGALKEDIGRGDITTEAICKVTSKSVQRDFCAVVICKEPIEVAGWNVFVRVFQLLGLVDVISTPEEGCYFPSGEVGRLQADPFLLLKGERVALNLFQKTCGIATTTARLVKMVEHTGVQLLDTRKTTPLWRDIEKYAVRIGGGKNHRYGLDDAILIKDNHIAIAGSVKAAIEACRFTAPHLCRVEVEVSSLDQLEEAIVAGAEVVLLDNMSPKEARYAVQRASSRCQLEASGGITEDNVVAYAETGVDFISIGSLTHSVRSCDVSIELKSIEGNAN